MWPKLTGCTDWNRVLNVLPAQHIIDLSAVMQTPNKWEPLLICVKQGQELALGSKVYGIQHLGPSADSGNEDKASTLRVSATEANKVPRQGSEVRDTPTNKIETHSFGDEITDLI